MRADLSITYDDNEGSHYLNFDRILGNDCGTVATGGYIGVREDDDGTLHIFVVDQGGDVVMQCDVPVTKMIGG